MYIDVVPDEVIWTINWLHYLNYEHIDCTSSTCYLVLTRNNLGQTVTSYGWCNVVPCAVPFFRLFSERFASERLSYEGKRVFHVSIFFLVRLGNGFVSGCLSYGQASTYCPFPTYYVAVLVFVCLYLCTTLAPSPPP